MIAWGPKFMLKLWPKQASRSTAIKNLLSWRYKFKVNKTKNRYQETPYMKSQKNKILNTSQQIWPPIILQETSQSQNIWQWVITERPLSFKLQSAEMAYNHQV